MNVRVQVAQATIDNSSNSSQPHIVKIAKPQGSQAITVRLDGATRLDLSDVSDEKVTFVRVGDRLIVLFDNQSTVTIEPFFDSAGAPIGAISVELGGDRVVTGGEFASLFPITADQSVLPAAGEGGSPTAGANFNDPTVDPLSTGTPLDLLGNTDGAGGADNAAQAGNTKPIIGSPATGGIDDEGLSEGILGGPGDAPGEAASVTGSLDIDFGLNLPATLIFATTQPSLAGITSGGQPVAYILTTLGGLPAVVGYLDGTDPAVAANQVYTITLDTGGAGSYTFTLLQPFDHPIAGTEDSINLSIQFTVMDSDGDTASGAFTVIVNDDSPEIAGDAISDLLAALEPLDGQATTFTGGSLGISWGADRSNSHPNGGVDTAGTPAIGGTGDRSVVLTAVSYSGFEPSSEAGRAFATLYSNGAEVHVVLSADGTTLIGYTGDEPLTLPFGEAPPANLVFVATVSDDDADGGYAVTLYQQLDHLATVSIPDFPSTTDHFTSVDLTFSFVATDADGDAVASTFTITVDDTTPVFDPQSVENGSIDEETIPGISGNAGDSYGDGGDLSSDPGSDAGNARAISGALGIDWKADIGNAGLADRALVFRGIDESGPDPVVARDANGHAITSGHQAVYYHVTTGIDGQPMLVAYTGEDATDSAHWVFTVSLDDVTTTYRFELFKPLDHSPETGAGAEDDIVLGFDFTAIDADGDPVDGSFTVTIDDDAPVQNAEKARGRLDEDDLDNYHPIAHAFGWPIEGSHGTSPDDDTTWSGATATSGSLSALVDFGADGPAGGGGFSFAFADTETATAAVAALGLHSKGDDIDTARLIGDWLIAGTGDRVVFALKLDDDGSYRFVLFDQLDHPKGDNPETDTPEAYQDRIRIDLSSFIQATDGDGDAVVLDDGSFVIRVVDDVPKVVGHEHHSVAENDLADLNPLYPAVFDFWQGSIGTSPYDGPGDGSITGLFGTVPVWGALADNIKGGADERGEFHLVSQQKAGTLLEGLGPDGYLTSKGKAIDVVRMVTINGIGDVLGFFAHDGRLVFGLYLNETGIYNFRLFDQIDHPAGDDSGTLAPEAVADTVEIDLSGFVTYTDYDGDTVGLGDGMFVIGVVDDIPQVIGSIAITLDEDDLADYNAAWIDDLFEIIPWQGSIGTSPGSETDPILKTTSHQGFLNEIIGHNTVNGGADEFGHFGVVSAARAGELLAGLNWFSNGDKIDHVRVLEIDELGTVMGFFAHDGRLVMSLSVADSGALGVLGAYDLRLFDQIDHTGANGDTIALDLSKFVIYTDSDGDVIDLGSGNFVLTVVDDAPEVVVGAKVSVTVEEENNASLLSLLGDMGHGNEDAAPEADHDESGPGTTSAIASGSLSALVKGGADDKISFAFDQSIENTAVRTVGGDVVTSHGHTVRYDLQELLGYEYLVGYADANGNHQYDAGERLVFGVALSDLNPLDVNVNDIFTYVQLDQIDHADPAGASIEDTLSLDLSPAIKVTDADDDTVHLADGSFVVDVIDDTPVQKAGPVVVGTVEEEELAGGVEDDSASPDVDDDFVVGGFPVLNFTTATATGNLRGLVSVGADETATDAILGVPFAWRGSFALAADTGGLPVLKSNGAVISYQVADSADADMRLDTLLGYVDANENQQYDAGERQVFTLKVTADGDYTFTLLDQIDHSSVEGQSIENVATLDFSSIIRFSDNDGDTIGLTANTFTVRVVDDTPVAAISVTGYLNLDETRDGSPSDVDANGGDEAGKTDPFGVGALLAISSGTIFSDTSKMGADQPVSGGKAYALVLNNTASGLVDAVTNEAIALSQAGGNIVGKNASGQTVFVIGVNGATGEVTVAQYRTIEHNDANDADESGSSAATIANGAVSLKVTLDDADGDHTSAAADLGSHIRFEDDGAVVTAVDTKGLAMNWPSAVSVTGDIAVSYGNDGFGALKITGWPTIAGVTTTLSGDGHTLEASYNGSPLYTLTIDPTLGADGYSFVLHQAWPSTAHAVTVTASQFAGGNSGDYTFGEVTFTGINPFNTSLTAFDGGFGVGNASGLGAGINNDYITNNEKFGVTFANPMDVVTLNLQVNADVFGDGTVSVSWKAYDANNNLVASSSVPGSYPNNGTNTLTIDPAAAFTRIEVTTTTSGGGTPSMQVTGLTGKTMPLPPDDQDLQFQVTATDGDGDANSHALTVHLESVPVLTVTGTSVDEKGLPARGLEPAGSGENADANPGNNSDGTEIGTGTIKIASTDGLTEVRFSNAAAATVTVTLAQLMAASSASPRLVFDDATGKLEITGYDAPSGTVTYRYTLEDNADHSVAGADAQQFSVVAVDPDGYASVPASLTVTIVDDAPRVPVVTVNAVGVGDTATLIHDESTGLQGWNDGAPPDGPGTGGPDTDAPADADAEQDVTGPLAVFNGLGTAIGYAERAGAVSVAVDYGADGQAPSGTTLALTTAAGASFSGQATNLFDTATGHRIHLYTENGLVVGRVGFDISGTDQPNPSGAVAFALAISGTGTLSLAQYLAIKHPDGTDNDDAITLQVAGQGANIVFVTATSMDGDADVRSSTPTQLTIRFDDDGPTAIKDDPVSFDEDSGVHSGNVMTNDVVGADGATLTKVSFDHGATWKIIATDGMDIGGGDFQFTLAGVGVYTFDAQGNWSFTAAADFAGSTGFAYIITDGDGDESDPNVTIDNTLTIQVAPVADSPAGADKTVTLLEDGTHVFTAADFGFSDTRDNPPDSFTGVVISTIPGAGTLTNNGVAVVAGYVVSLADIQAGRLVFEPAADASGDGYASFTFQVQDSGSLSGGGANTDPTPNTITFDVAPVTDTPVVTVAPAAGPEDSPGIVLDITAAVSDLVGTPETITAVTIAGVVNGTLSAGADQGGGVWVLTPAQLAGLTFIPDHDFNGAVTLAVTATAQDGTAPSATSAPAQLLVTVESVNDTPTPASETVSVTEDVTVAAATRTAGVLGNDGDRDNGDAATLVVSAVLAGTNGTATAVTAGPATIVHGTYGDLSIKADGTYSYTPNKAAAQALPLGVHGSDVFTYTAQDTGGATATATLTFDVTGANDVPTAFMDTATMGEDDAPKTFNVVGNDRTDPDAGAPNNVTIGSIVVSGGGAYGITAEDVEVSLSGNDIQVDLTGSDWDKLRAYTNPVTITVFYSLHGDQPNDYLYGGNQLLVSVGGVNDAPTMSAVTTEVADTAAKEAGTGVATGNLLVAGNGADIDADPFGVATVKGAADVSPLSVTPVGVVAHGTYGTLTIADNGSYTYIANAAFDALTAGHSVTDTFDVVVKDVYNGSVASTLSVHITGANDIPVLSATLNGVSYVDTAADDAFSAWAGTLSATDADAGDTKTYGVSGGTPGSYTVGAGSYDVAATGSYGTLYVNSISGAYIFVPNDGAIEGLTSTAQETFTLTVTDSANATVDRAFTVDLTGANDTPTLTATPAGVTYTDTSADDTFTAATGVLSSSDRDTVDAATYSLTDGTAGTYVVNSVSYDVAKVGTYGTFYLDHASGAYTYVPIDGAIEALTGPASETFTMRVTDDGGLSRDAVYTVNLIGANDLPQALMDTGSMSEDSTAKSFAVLGNDKLDRDAGSADNVTLGMVRVDNLNGPGSSMWVNAEGSGLFTITVTPQNEIRVELVASAWDKLANGASATIAVGYNLHGNGADTAYNQLQVLVTGVNDAPVLVDKALVMTVAEDAGFPSGAVGVPVSSLADPGSLGNVVDPDASASYPPGIVITGFNAAAGTLYWSNDGGNFWQAVTSLGANALYLAPTGRIYIKPAANFSGAIDDAITFHASDRSGGFQGLAPAPVSFGGTTPYSADTDTVALTVTPEADPAVIGGTDSGSVTEDAVGGHVQTYTSDFESSTLGSDGGWTNGYVAVTLAGNNYITENNDIRGSQSISKVVAVPSGGPTTIEFDFLAIRTWDGLEKIRVYLNGSEALSFYPNAGLNPASPTSGIISLGAINAAYTITGPTTISEGRVYHVTITGTGFGSSVTLGFGDTLDQDHADENFGINNILVHTTVPSGIVASGDLTIVDPDAGQAAFVGQTDTAGSNGYGHFSVTAAGHWTYVLDNASSQVQALGNGETASDSFTVASVDGTTRTVTVTIHGTNDAPVLAVGGRIGDDLGGGYSGASGSPNIWTTNWTETGDDGAANGGDITHQTDYAFNQYIELTDSDDASSSIARTLDLAGMTSATLTFDYQRVQLESADDQVIVEVSSDGVNFTQIGVIGGGAFDDAAFQTASFDISAYASATTTIRFTATNGLDYGGGDFDWVRIDNVNVAYSGPNTFEDGGAAVAILAGADIVDIDDANIRSATVVLTNAQAGDELSLFGTTFAAGGGGSLFGMFSWTATLAAGALTVTFSGNTSKANWEYLLESLTFRNTSEQPSTVDRQFEITVGDGDANSNTVHATVKVDSVDELPVAVGDTVSVAEDAGPVTIDVFANDTDNDGGPKTITSVSQSAHGTVLITGGGTGLTFQPAANFSGDTSFTYTLNGGSTATVNVTVTPVADQPAINVAVSDPTPTPAGAEFRVNTFTGGVSQNSAAVTALSDGRFLVTWVTRNQISADDMFAQIYNADGTPSGSEFVVNATTGNYERFGAVTGLAGGGFVATYSANALDGSDYGIFGQRYDAAGARVGGEFQINNLVTAGNQHSTSVSELAGGGFVVTWQAENADGGNYGIQARIYNASGVAHGSEFAVNTQTAGNQTVPEVIGLAGGGFVIAWQSTNGIFAQMFGSTGVRVGGEFLVNTNPTGAKTLPDIAALENGGFVVSWTSSGQDGSSDGVYAQRYASDGTTVGGEFLVNTYVSDKQTNSTVIGLADGGFLISWVSTGQDGSNTGIYGQRFAADGSKVGTEFRISGSTVDNQDFDGTIGGAEIVQLADGSLVASWHGAPSVTGNEIYARQFSLPALPNSAEDSAVSIPSLAALLADTDGSETLAVVISSIPAGAVLSDGSHSFAASAGNQSVDVTGWDLTHLTITPVANYNGTFDLTVTATATEAANGDSASRTITIPVTVEAVNDAPTITSDGAGATATANVAESNTHVTTVTATDPESATLTYSIAGGVDAAKFTINPSTGALSFVAAPDYENPTDMGGDNVYDVDVQVSDGSLNDVQSIAVHVGNVADQLPVAHNDYGAIWLDPAYTMTEDEGARTFDVLSNDLIDSDPGAANNVTINTVRVSGLNGVDYNTLLDPTQSGLFEITVTQDNRVQVELVSTAWDKLGNGATATIQIGYALHGNGAEVSYAGLDVVVAGRNDAPVLSASASPSLSAQENDGVPVGNVGTRVSDLINAAGGSLGNVADPDTTYLAPGMVITALDASHGSWYYWSDSGANWNAVDLQAGQALYLLSTDKIYFKPAADFSGTVAEAITFHAWDRSNGSFTGVNSAPASYGGTTAYSSATDTASLTVESAPAAAHDDVISLVPAGWSWYAANGHIYKWVYDHNYLWDAAVTAAAAQRADSYLATITSAGEDAFVNGLNANYRTHLGGSDAGHEGTWTWVTGPEAGVVFYTTASGAVGYANWLGGEPNNSSGSSGAENALATVPGGQWNDLSEIDNSNLDDIGYTAEAGAPGATYAAINEDAAFTFEGSWLLANDADASAHIQSVSATSSKGAAVSYNSATGQITYDPTGAAALQALGHGATTPDTFTYAIDDGHGGTSTATVTVTVSGVYDAPTIADTGFENPGVGTGYVYNPAGSAWTFSGAPGSGSGLEGNGSAFVAPNAPGGTQAAFVQNQGTIQQSFTIEAGSYTATVSAAGRGVYNGANPVKVYLDNVEIGSFTPAVGVFGQVSIPFTVATAGTHVLKFAGQNTSGDATTFIDNVAITCIADPVILDLDHDGYAFSGLAQGVRFDIDGDGIKDHVAWNRSGDGILAIDLDGDGAITNGKELFTPSFAGGHFASGSEALASLDANGDGILDGQDAAFASLLAWKDANADGVSEADELTSLADNGVVSIDVATTARVDAAVDGQQIVGEGTFTRADGTTGGFVEVALETEYGHASNLSGTEGDDTLLAANGGALFGGAGADHFRFNAPTDGLDSILDFNSGESDLIEILGSAFGGLSVGAVDAAAFEQVSGNVDASAKTFVFDATTDTLYWNADGAGGQAAVALAHLENGYDVTAADLRIV
ncbi:VCBS domain-containing protein [Xanthobacteraceae bacterium Astr-EGSB]|uniref:DUF5801 repeats-in-toxin domain-containing protein n=1 Tax=Astrobacterium formosum TaxID=3069710 RepID=UPI0027AEE5D0|nr:VCBS domain-containing protein [Xanthobacteraceae bacterium Astr-EGSB]